MHSDTEFAERLGVHRATIWRWKKAGMPTASLSAAQSWVDARSRSVPVEGIDAVPVAVDNDESPYAVRDRLRSAERMIASEIAGLDKALKEVRRQGDEARAYQLAQTLRSARREHREASDAALKAEGRVISLEKTRGTLISFGEAQDYVSRVLNPVLIWMRRLADSARSDEEKALLKQLREAGLAVVRTAADATTKSVPETVRAAADTAAKYPGETH